ncbi:MAG: hypothetical protein SH856_06555 [Flavobacteriales bacterium]|nr:hypothetical protein [Flavobacteriales bacterium]
MKVKSPFLLLLSLCVGTLFSQAQVQTSNSALLTGISLKSFHLIPHTSKIRGDLPSFFQMQQEEDGKKRKMMNSPGYGALTGFVIGGIGGTVLGLTGKEWTLKDGSVVSRPIHAVVDAIIVGAPLGIMGLVWGARKDRSTLSPSRWHAAIGGGWSSGMPYQSMLNAAAISGIPRHIPHWFGYLHYPNGENSSTPYTWNLSVDYNFAKHFSAGLAFNNFVMQQVVEGDHPDHENPWHDYEFVKGESYSLVADYILNPIKPENKTRLVFAAGAGASLHRMLAGGVLGDVEYEQKKLSVTPHYRVTLDYMSRKSLSLQLKAGYKPFQTINVPEQISGDQNLIAHTINMRALDVTVGIRYHFDKLPF